MSVIAHAPRRLGFAVAALCALLVAACGSSGPAGGGETHDNPSGAVKGFVNALAKNDLKTARDWVAPSERTQFDAFLNSGQFKVSFNVTSFNVVGEQIDKSNPNHATVTYNGQANGCFSGNIQGIPVNTCEALNQGTSKDSPFDCVRESGQWYVSLGSSSSSDTSSSTDTGSSSSTDTGSSSSSDTSSSDTTSSDTSSSSS